VARSHRSRPVQERVESGLGERNHLAGTMAPGQGLRDPSQPAYLREAVDAVARRSPLRHREAVALLPDADRVGGESRGPRDGSDGQPELGRGAFPRVPVAACLTENLNNIKTLQKTACFSRLQPPLPPRGDAPAGPRNGDIFVFTL